MFADYELSVEEIKSIIKRGGVKKNKPVLSVDGKIWFNNTLDPQKLNKYLPDTLKTIDIYVDYKDQYTIRVQ